MWVLWDFSPFNVVLSTKTLWWSHTFHATTQKMDEPKLTEQWVTYHRCQNQSLPAVGCAPGSGDGLFGPQAAASHSTSLSASQHRAERGSLSLCHWSANRAQDNESTTQSKSHQQVEGKHCFIFGFYYYFCFDIATLNLKSLLSFSLLEPDI